jgi:peptidoglycan hydrolase CwlO-like protein
MNKSLSLVAALLAVIAIAISTTGKSGSTSGPEMDQSKSRNPGQQFEKLEDQLRQATETIETLSRKIEKLETRPAQSSATATDNSELQQRIAALEAQQQAMTKFTNDFDQYGVVSSMEA